MDREPRVFEFKSSPEAYDIALTMTLIRSGDVLCVPSERVVGVFVYAWPVAISKERGTFHYLLNGQKLDTYRNGEFAASAALARKVLKAIEAGETWPGTERVLWTITTGRNAARFC
jgi:hypothetical protein